MIVCVLFLSVLSVNVIADTDTVDIPPREWSDASVGWQRLVLEAGEYVVWNWTSTDSLDFQLFDPDGNQLMNQEQSVGTNGMVSVDTPGTYSWRYANWHEFTVTVTVFWGRIERANTVDQRLRELEEAYVSLNQSVKWMMGYLDDLALGPAPLSWLAENLSITDDEIEGILQRMESMPVDSDLDEMNEDIEDLSAEITRLNEDLTKVRDDNARHSRNVNALLLVMIVLIAIALVLAMRHGGRGDDGVGNPEQ